MSADLSSLSEYRPEPNKKTPKVAPPLAFPIISLHYDLTDDKAKIEYPSDMQLQTVRDLLRTAADELPID